MAGLNKRKFSNGDQQSINAQQNDEVEHCPVQKKARMSQTWRNINLITSLQKNSVEDQRKIELAFEFIASDANFSDGAVQAVSTARLASFLSDWVQPLLIPREKSSGFAFDYRCWVVLKFCLKNSVESVSLNLLKSFALVMSVNMNDSVDKFFLIESAAECAELILSSNTRAFYNASMDVWKPCIIEIGNSIRNHPENDSVTRLSCVLLEHFGNHLRFHKDPSGTFSKFVGGLLEPLLELLVLLHIRNKNRKCQQVGILVRLVEDILLNGVFHPANISGYFNLKKVSAGKGMLPMPKGFKDFRTKLGIIITEKKATTLLGFGYLFRLFVKSNKSQRGSQILTQRNESISTDKESNKPIFDVFIQFMQPLLLECNKYSRTNFAERGVNAEDKLLETICLLQSLNETLFGFIQEKVYIRTADTSEEDHYKFLKEIYDAIVSISIQSYQLWLTTLDKDKSTVQKLIALVAKESVSAIGHLLEIEYKVAEDDIIKLWLIMFSFLTIENQKVSSQLTTGILNLGCKLINIYNDLRQVSSPLFALCKAVRVFGNVGASDVSQYSLFFSPSLSSHIYINSLDSLLCSQELLSAISDAIKMIPEGQASACIRQLEIDVADSLQWIRSSSETNLYMQSQLLGRLISKLYTTVLDSLTVTATNSIAIAKSIDGLIEALGASFNNLVGSQIGSVDEFIYSVIGRKLSGGGECEINIVSWIFVFYFLLYISCRSLYRQLISFLPPDSSENASQSMGVLFTIASENEWKENYEIIDEGYFSWIAKPSISLAKLIKNHLKYYFSNTACSTLHYVVRIMALQRINDLNHLIQAFEFFEKRDTEISGKKLKQYIKVKKQEAAKLTKFMLGHKRMYDCSELYIPDNNACDMGSCSLNERSLCIAIWKLLCHNVDVWCAHSTKKYLNKFVSSLFFNATQDVKCSGQSTMQHVSLEFLTNIVSYEQPVLRKHFTSGFCQAMERLLSPMMTNLYKSEVDMSLLPDCSDLLSILMDKSSGGLDGRIVSLNEGHSSYSSSEFKTCDDLLHLFSKIPKVCLDAKSFSSYATHVLYLERLVVSNLLNTHGNPSTCNSSELIKLLITCRRAMKYLSLSSIEDDPSFEESFVFNTSNFMLWLLKSVSDILKLTHNGFLNKYHYWEDTTIFPLIDHTSFIFLAVGDRNMNAVKSYLNNNEELNTECHVDIIAEMLEEQLTSLGSLDNVNVVSRSNFAVIISCFQGFIWGILSSIDSSSESISTLKLYPRLLPKLMNCITLFETVHLGIIDNGNYLQILLNTEDPQVAFTVRQLFNASAAIYKLKIMLYPPKYIKETCASSISALLEKSVAITLKMLQIIGRENSYSYVWLDGVLTFLEVCGSCGFDLELPEDFYVQLIDTFIVAIGKCISLQGKSATLSSHDSISSIKMLRSHQSKSNNNGMQNYDQVKLNIAALKGRLRVLFKNFIKLKKCNVGIALQSLEKTLLGLRKDCFMVFELNLGSKDGGVVSSTVAAGVDCLDLALESLSGNDALNQKIPSFISAVFNIISHLQNPKIFYCEKQPIENFEVKPDAGAVILMCVEILINIVGNISFKIDTWQISQCLHIPLALFSGIYQIKLEGVEDEHSGNVARKFCVDLYASCCRLLSTAIKHHKRNAEQCIAVLEESVNTLLNCLEMVDTDLSKDKGYFSWDIEEAIKCASFLRRIYEELRSQKDFFADYAPYFLSHYISTYSGSGPLKTGIKREIDEALKPGIYSLIDICDKDDLRHLHISFSEGPCRSTLKALKHDYEVNFQYGGKI